MMLFIPDACSRSPNKNADRITPNTGFIKPNTATLDTGLYFNKIPHKDYATAVIHARENSMAIPAAVTIVIFPPINSPIMVITRPPDINCQPLKSTGFSVLEYRFK